MTDGVALGWPVDTEGRDAILTVLPQLQRIPYYTGSNIYKCCFCSIEIYVGPRVSELVGAGAVEPICIWCLVALRVAGQAMDTVDLANPENPFLHLPPSR